MPDPARFAISAATAGSGYTLDMTVGSQEATVSVLVDTGSSMTAVLAEAYDPAADPSVETTQLVQSASFGNGNMLAAVVQARLGLVGDDTRIVMPRASLGVVYQPSPGLFGRASGILGLAYPALSVTRRMPTDTWATKYTPAACQAADEATPVPPLLDQLVASGQIVDRFAFSIRRSFASQAADAAAAMRLNTGVLVLGGDSDDSGLYTGPVESISVLNETYFGVTLLAVVVGGQTVPVPALSAGSPAGSNAFLDSGCNHLQFPGELYSTVLAQFPDTQRVLIRRGYADQTQVDLATWPDLRLTLQGSTGATVTLTIAPEDYWQFDGYGPGRARSTLLSGATPFPGQSILGLPVFANRYVAFDRTQGPGRGVIKFAAQAPAGTAPLTS